MPTVTVHSAGAVTGATAAATPQVVAYPVTVPAGKKAVMWIEAKPFNTTVVVPTGWSLAPPTGQATNGSTAGGLNTGSMRAAWLELDTLTTGSEGGTTVSVTLTTGDSTGAQIILLESDTGAFVASISAFGSKVGNSANMSAVCSTGTFTDLLAGDLVLEAFAMNASLGTPSADTITQTGVTYGTVTNQGDRPVTTGNDSRLRVNSVPVTSVTTPSGSPTVGYTNASATSGVGSVLRIRGAAGVAGDAALSATDAVTSSGIVGALAAATLAAAVAITAAGVVDTSSGGTVAETGTITSAGQVGTSTGSSIAATATLTAAGSVAGSGLSATASIAATDTIASAGVVGKATGASIAETATLAASGVVGRATGTSLPGTAALASSGVVGTAGGATLSSTDTTTAAGQIGTASSSTLAATGTINAAGTVARTAAASLAGSVAITAAGAVGSASSTGSAQLATVVVIAATGTVGGATSQPPHIAAVSAAPARFTASPVGPPLTPASVAVSAAHATATRYSSEAT